MNVPVSTASTRAWVIAVFTFAAAFAAVIPSVGARQVPASADRLVASFLGELQRAVDHRDRRAVAGMIRYPITILVSGWQVPVRDAATLVTSYDSFFTPEMRCLIVQSGVPRSNEPAPLNPVKVMSDGISIGDGRIWAQRTGTTFQITRLIVPPSAPMRFVAQAPRRVIFSGSASAQRPAQFTGVLAGDAVESFLVSARKGQLLQASINGFRGSDVTVRVFDQKTGKPVEARTPDGVRTWRGVIPADAAYRIDVVRLAPYCDPPLQYLLGVTLR
jgi:hypothetical protein